MILLQQGVVGGPGHSPRVDVEELAPCPRAPMLVALPPGIEQRIPPQSRRDRSVLPHRRQRQPAKDKCRRNNVDDGVWLGVVHLLRAPVRDLSPPRRSPAVECAQRALSTQHCTLSVLIAHFVHTFWNTTHFVYTVFVLCAYLLKNHRTVCTHSQYCACTYNTLSYTQPKGKFLYLFDLRSNRTSIIAQSHSHI